MDYNSEETIEKMVAREESLVTERDELAVELATMAEEAQGFRKQALKDSAQHSSLSSAATGSTATMLACASLGAVAAVAATFKR